MLFDFLGRSVGLSEDTCARVPCTARLVTASERRLRLMSTSRLYQRRKSAPKIGVATSATIKTHRNDRRQPRSRVSERVPYVDMEVPLTACSTRSAQ